MAIEVACQKQPQDHAVEFEDLSTIEGYEAFVRSPEYQQWLQFQNQLQL